MDNPLRQHIPLYYPLKRIVFATPDMAGAAIMLRITWDAGIDMRIPEMEGAGGGGEVSGWARMADMYIRADIPWATPDTLERYISEIGWALGAGYMYRWHKAPGMHREHLWGLIRYSTPAGELAMGDSSEELSALAAQHGCWEWEINAAYRKANGHTAMYWPAWRAADPSLDDDGGRSKPFPGWDGYHPWLRATQPYTAFISRYYYCHTSCREQGACYRKNLQW